MDKCIITCDELALMLQNASELVVLDATLTPIGETAVERMPCLPRAQFFDIEGQGSAPDSVLPHTLPSATDFEQYARDLGINKTSDIVIYDCHGLYSSARAWWMFKAMGHENVFVLQGGRAAWLQAGFTAENSYTQTKRGDFCAHFNAQWLATLEDMRANLASKASLVVDARARGRFAGEVAEPREGLASGHIPGAINIPYTELFSEGHWLPEHQMATYLQNAGVSDERSTALVFSCGSGITACLPLLAAWQCGYRNVAVYDGSWVEWGGDSALPVATGGA